MSFRRMPESADDFAYFKTANNGRTAKAQSVDTGFRRCDKN